MAKELYNTPNLDELEKGPWPSFVTGLKRLQVIHTKVLIWHATY